MDSWCALLVLLGLFLFNDTATTEIYTYGHTLPLHDALPICHQLHRAGQADAAHLADQRVIRQRREALLQVGADVLAHPRDEVLFLDDGDVLQRHRAGHRMAGVGEAVRELAALPPQQIGKHTSELQSLMRIAYAVFGLKKKTRGINSSPVDQSSMP